MGVSVWILLVGAGLQFLWSYENKATPSLKASRSIPDGHSFSLDPKRSTIVVFAHPHCPCSRASLAELEKSLSTFTEAFSTRIYFYLPKGQSKDWVQSDLWRKAGRFPATALYLDHEGQEARKFKATTSGEVFVYSPEGRMLFHGGLTAARGHEGASLGTRSLKEIAHVGSSEVVEAPVFGCTLFQNNSQTLGGS